MPCLFSNSIIHLYTQKYKDECETLRNLNVFTFCDPFTEMTTIIFAPIMSANYTFILKNSGNDATYSGYLDKTVCLVSANNLPKTCPLRAI